MGHALNKALKDFINRSYAMRGYYTPYIPGWDNHGMPIESAIIKQNKLNHKAMSVADFRTACHQFADHYIDVQREGFKRMGVVADWEHPYKTMDPGFEAREVPCLRQMYKKAAATSTRASSPCTGAPTTRPPWPRPRSSIRTTPAPRCM